MFETINTWIEFTTSAPLYVYVLVGILCFVITSMMFALNDDSVLFLAVVACIFWPFGLPLVVFLWLCAVINHIVWN